MHFRWRTHHLSVSQDPGRCWGAGGRSGWERPARKADRSVEFMDKGALGAGVLGVTWGDCIAEPVTGLPVDRQAAQDSELPTSLSTGLASENSLGPQEEDRGILECSTPNLTAVPTSLVILSSGRPVESPEGSEVSAPASPPQHVNANL